MTLEDVVTHVGEFEERERRLFGTVEWDFRYLYFWITKMKLPYGGLDVTEDSHSFLAKTSLQDVAIDVLHWEGAGFSDGDVTWLGYEKEPTYDTWKYYYTMEEFNTKQVVKKEMVEFFQGLKGESCPVRQVQDMLFRLGFNRDTLYKCSR